MSQASPPPIGSTLLKKKQKKWASKFDHTSHTMHASGVYIQHTLYVCCRVTTSVYIKFKYKLADGKQRRCRAPATANVVVVIVAVPLTTTWLQFFPKPQRHSGIAWAPLPPTHPRGGYIRACTRAAVREEGRLYERDGPFHVKPPNFLPIPARGRETDESGTRAILIEESQGPGELCVFTCLDRRAHMLTGFISDSFKINFFPRSFLYPFFNERH